MEDKIKIYNELCNIAFVNIFSLGKENNIIYFKDFNSSNKSHLCLYEMSKAAAAIWEYNIYFENKLFITLKNKLKLKAKKKFIISNDKNEGITCDDFIDNIEIKNNKIGYFSEIYEEFYKTGK